MERDDVEHQSPFAPPSRGETLVPAVAVAAVAVVAVAAALMARGGDESAPRQQPPAQVAQHSSGPVANAEVVHAPPLDNAPATHAMGGAPACERCGVVQMVVAVYEHGGKQPRAYQMHVRMDDGSLRTIEQRGALAAGSRVRVDGSSVRPIS